MCKGCGDGLVARVARGLAGLARYIAGDDPADPSEVKRRRDICRTCRYAGRTQARNSGLPVLTSSSRCTACKCFIVAKTALASERCPKGKWPAVERRP